MDKENIVTIPQTDGTTADVLLDRHADFDLPDVSGGPKAKPRIHNAGESTCVSCEG